MMTVDDLLALVPGAALLQGDGGQAIQHLLTDSRILSAQPGAMFFALSGPNHDGHRYLQECYDKGVRLFCVSVPATLPESATLVQVPDVLGAMQALAARHRAGFNYPVVAITGSNGKTIVKEWLYQICAHQLAVVKSPRSYNSQVGVPLSVWQMQPYHELAIFEAGVSRRGEMESLAHIIAPTVGIFTHLGTAHDEGFASRRQKFDEKWKLFASCKSVIYQKDGTQLSDWISQTIQAGQQPIGWQISRPPVSTDGNRSYVVGLDIDGNSHMLTLPFGDRVQVENACQAIVCALHLGVLRSVADLNPADLTRVAMRLEWKDGIAGSHLLDDSWSNDLDGLLVALDKLTAYGSPRQQKVLILSDMLEAGRAAPAYYARAAEAIGRAGFTRILIVGHELESLQLLPQNITSYYADTEVLLADLDPSHISSRLVLIKGARRFGFERIVHRLEAQTHATRLEVDLNALAANYHFFKSRLRPGTRIMAMVKAGAYGTGSYEIASTLAYLKVDYLSVAYTDEGIALRNQDIAQPIMVMSPMAGQFDQCIRQRLEPVIFGPDMLEAWLATPAHGQPIPPMHLELNTGMNRLGFDDADLPNLLRRLMQSPQHRVASIFTHLAAADDPAQDDFTRTQLFRYRVLSRQILDRLGYPILCHALNTAGAARFPEESMDMVRLGVGLYGVEVPGTEGAGLETVGRLRSRVTQVRTVPAGESVGYGHRWTLPAPARIATVAIGYADGFSRNLGNGRFSMRIHGSLAPTIGNVCMDMTMLDVTGLDVQAGDEVTIFDDHSRLEDLARAEGTIAYEVLTRISERVQRVYVST